MREIKANTTFYNPAIGRVRSGDVVEVEDEMAKQLTQSGFASYNDADMEYETIDETKYPKRFLSTELPDDFPHRTLLSAEDVNTFGDLIRVDELLGLANIGTSRAEDIKESLNEHLERFIEVYG